MAKYNKISENNALNYYNKLLDNYENKDGLENKVSSLKKLMENEILKEVTGISHYNPKYENNVPTKDGQHGWLINNQRKLNNGNTTGFIPKEILKDIERLFSWRNVAEHPEDNQSIFYGNYIGLFTSVAQIIKFFSDIQIPNEINSICNPKEEPRSPEKKYKEEEENPPQKTKKKTIKEVKKIEDIKYDRDYWKKKSSKENFALVNKILEIIKEFAPSLELSYNQQKYIGIRRNYDEAWNFIKIIPSKTFFRIKFRHPKVEPIDDIIKENNFKAKYDAKEDGKGNEDRYWIDLNENDINGKREVLLNLIKKSYEDCKTKNE